MITNNIMRRFQITAVLTLCFLYFASGAPDFPTIEQIKEISIEEDMHAVLLRILQSQKYEQFPYFCIDFTWMKRNRTPFRGSYIERGTNEIHICTSPNRLDSFSFAQAPFQLNPYISNVSCRNKRWEVTATSIDNPVYSRDYDPTTHSSLDLTFFALRIRNGAQDKAKSSQPHQVRLPNLKDIGASMSLDNQEVTIGIGPPPLGPYITLTLLRSSVRAHNGKIRYMPVTSENTGSDSPLRLYYPVPSVVVNNQKKWPGLPDGIRRMLQLENRSKSQRKNTGLFPSFSWLWA